MLYDTLQGLWPDCIDWFTIFERQFSKCPQFLEFLEQGQITTPRTKFSNLCEKCMGSLMTPSDQYREDA